MIRVSLWAEGMGRAAWCAGRLRVDLRWGGCAFAMIGPTFSPRLVPPRVPALLFHISRPDPCPVPNPPALIQTHCANGKANQFHSAVSPSPQRERKGQSTSIY